MPRILIEYASAKGSTEGIARRIGECCENLGADTKIVSAEQDSDLGRFDAVILGSAVHDRDWLPPARTAVDRLLAGEQVPPVWAFSVSTWGETSSLVADRLTRRIRATAREPNTVARLRSGSDLRDHRQFAGVVRRGDWPLFGRCVFALMGGKYGDARDWSDIEQWAEGIVTNLRNELENSP
ncbi:MULTISPECIES: flavodoxin domain-containing protein [Rhodococcus]|uniref:Menaquinone-dependent protoporphyrinogen oxidase n=1 Tax=Nocardia globerula TaxID=1818 RepID=A0A652YM53_NOCGL|nr:MULTISPECIES: flavodoxin domain-containing protein [Rhodococcus]MCE4263545.1 hypothetical protein [Rhodococcus globerulus]NMD62162.1 hypothetical protein [Nocardia globerula]PVX65747.1 menaquinone-dependent protoporphyrinogen oxidase [Rhodococcus globerulus]